MKFKALLCNLNEAAYDTFCMTQGRKTPLKFTRIYTGSIQHLFSRGRFSIFFFIFFSRTH